MSAKTLVDRLRDWDAYADFGRIKADCAIAANELERLRAALVEIADPNCIRTSDSFRSVARAALEESK